MSDVIESLLALAGDPAIDGDDRQEIRAAMGRILSRRQAAARERERSARHAQILPRCTAAKEQVEVLNRQAAEANGMVASIASDLHRARMALSEHLGRRPTVDSYPTARELEAFEKETARLEAAVAAAEEASRNHNARLAAIKQAGFQALGEFHRLAGQERALRPAEAQQAAR